MVDLSIRLAVLFLTASWLDNIIEIVMILKRGPWSGIERFEWRRVGRFYLLWDNQTSFLEEYDPNSMASVNCYGVIFYGTRENLVG